MKDLIKQKSLYDDNIRCFIENSINDFATMNVVWRFSRVKCMDKYIIEVKDKNDYLNFRNELIGKLKMANEKLSQVKHKKNSNISAPDFFLKYRLCLVEGIDEIRYNEINTYHNEGQITEKQVSELIERYAKDIDEEKRKLIKEYSANRQEYEFCRRRLTGTQFIYSYFDEKQNKRVTRSAPTIFAVFGNTYPIKVLQASPRRSYYPTKTILSFSQGLAPTEIYIRKRKKS